MLINEVESIVKISKKNIRYYEDQGLINPKRNKDNDYRIYEDKDIEKLKFIKFLRELNVPINDIKKLDNNEIKLEEIMKERIKKIEEEEKDFQKIKTMCQEIIENNEVKVSKYSEEIHILKKKGFTMKEIEKNNKNKIIGATISSIIGGLIFLLFVALFTYIQFFEDERMPWIIYTIFMIIFGVPLVGIIYNYILRVKEILGGEENEASKY